MRLMSTCVLIYAMSSLQRCLPCIFVINVVTSTSMQTRLYNVSDFRDLVISLSLCLLFFCCHVNLMLQRDPCIFWRCSVRMFCRYSCGISIHTPVCNYGVPLHVLILLYFCYKMFLADCLHVIQFCQGCCSWSIHAMYFLLPWLASLTRHLAVGMLVLSCITLWWVHQAHKDAFIILLCHVQFC